MEGTLEDTVLKIAMAGFFHDMGKFIHGDTLGITREYRDRNAALYQPSREGRHTHDHALFTAWFIEHPEARKHIPPCCNHPGWGEGDAFLNLAAMHHKPETAMQWIITEADRLSSGSDREKYEDARAKPKDYQKVRLAPLFEALDPDGGKAALENKWAYPLAPLGPETLFPIRRNEAAPDTWEGAKKEYAELVRGFMEELGRLCHARENTALWFEHFDSLVLRYTACVPSDRSGAILLPDVSLYEHLKSTSALAAALYLYHRDTGALAEKAIKEEEEKKFLIVHGDFHGIQDYIAKGYGEARKLRSKLLRGRSFSVSLITDLAADLVLRKCGLPFSSCVTNAAGKFSIIAPNTKTARAAIDQAREHINEWLFAKTLGESGLGIETIEAAPRDFQGGENGYPALMDRIAQAMETRKYKRFDIGRHGGEVAGYLDSFKEGGSLCRLCGKRPLSLETALETARDKYLKGNKACATCRDQAFFGERLAAKSRRLAVTKADADIHGQDNRLLDPVFGEYQVAFLKGDLKDLAREGSLLHYWDLGSPEAREWNSDITLHHVGGYIPRVGEDAEDLRIQGAVEAGDDPPNPEEPKTFSMIAAMAKNPGDKADSFLGVEALGVLKADVDDLGLLMACGIPEGRRTMSRIGTLSRQLHTFFSVYLPHLLATDRRFKDIYTVFAGGDDLFLIGPWNRCIELALFLNREFERYVCGNPKLHFSAGISLHKPGTPVPVLAELAEKALTDSKDPEKQKECLARDKAPDMPEGGKNRLTVFGATATWKDAHAIFKHRDALKAWFDAGVINTAFLYRLNDFIAMAAAEKRIGKVDSMPLKDMACTRWHALLAYSVERNAAKESRAAERMETREIILATVHQWLCEYGDALRMALWSILYNTRRR
jgi:CRISPR-associated protein Csm1